MRSPYPQNVIGHVFLNVFHGAKKVSCMVHLCSGSRLRMRGVLIIYVLNHLSLISLCVCVWSDVGGLREAVDVSVCIWILARR